MTDIFSPLGDAVILARDSSSSSVESITSPDSGVGQCHAAAEVEEKYAILNLELPDFIITRGLFPEEVSAGSREQAQCQTLQASLLEAKSSAEREYRGESKESGGSVFSCSFRGRRLEATALILADEYAKAHALDTSGPFMRLAASGESPLGNRYLRGYLSGILFYT